MLSDTYVKKTRMDGINLADGSVKCYLDIDESYYYEMLSDLLGQPVESEYELLDYLEEASKMQKEYKKVLQAIDQVRRTRPRYRIGWFSPSVLMVSCTTSSLPPYTAVAVRQSTGKCSPFLR